MVRIPSTSIRMHPFLRPQEFHLNTTFGLSSVQRHRQWQWQWHCHWCRQCHCQCMSVILESGDDGWNWGHIISIHDNNDDDNNVDNDPNCLNCTLGRQTNSVSALNLTDGVCALILSRNWPFAGGAYRECKSVDREQLPVGILPSSWNSLLIDSCKTQDRKAEGTHQK